MLVLVLLGVVTLYIAIRILHLTSQAEAPTLHCKNTTTNRRLIRECPLLTDVYVPPLLWGKNGHLQTMVYGKLGRVKSPFPRGERCSIVLADGATMTFDVFERHKDHPSGNNYMLVICPGIANSSESLYVCTCVDYAQNAGYRVAVLNHLGALPGVKLTAPRIFTYGGTEEYGMMTDYLLENYPDTKLIAIGFSMGANIVMRYIGQESANQDKFIACMSFCQGYCPYEAFRHLLTWEHLRYMYIWAMTQHQKLMLKRHRDVLFSPEAVAKYNLNEKEILKSFLLSDLDERYSRRRAGASSIDEYYKSNSCVGVLDNIHIPTFIMNTTDDPLVPSVLHDIPRQLAIERDNVIFATTKHGGHLGFFEGSMFIPETITWLDKIVVQMADAFVTVQEKSA